MTERQREKCNRQTDGEKERQRAYREKQLDRETTERDRHREKERHKERDQQRETNRQRKAARQMYNRET